MPNTASILLMQPMTINYMLKCVAFFLHGMGRSITYLITEKDDWFNINQVLPLEELHIGFPFPLIAGGESLLMRQAQFPHPEH